MDKDSIDIAVEANTNVDRVSNQLNDPDHSMPGTEDEADCRSENRLENAIDQELSGNHEGAMEELGNGLHTIQDKYAHSRQNAGWSEHNPLSNDYTAPDDATRHINQYREAYRESTQYIDKFIEETK